jgi:hypothetical protein
MLFTLVVFQMILPTVKMRAFWDIVPCSLVGVDRRFRDVYCPIIRAIQHEHTDSSIKPESVPYYSGRKITESLGNITVRGAKVGKSKRGAQLSTVCLSMYSITENMYCSQLSSVCDSSAA